MYKSINNSGYVFYKKLLRAKLDVPLVLVCNRQYKSIDEKIKHDRDRKAFNDAVLELLLKYILNQVDKSVIVNTLKPWWEKGHKVLRILASRYSRIKIPFPDNYYAKHSKTEIINYSMQMQVDQLEQEFQKKGYIQCPVYMAKLGMKSAVSVIKDGIAKMKKKHQTLYTRSPTEQEGRALNILNYYIGDVDRLLADRFSTATYTIGDSDDLVGELRRGRMYRSRNVYLSQNFFLFDFSEALATLMHEWGHIYGYDGSRSFTDALTEFLVAIIKGRDELDKVEKKFNRISLEIKNTYLNGKSFPRMHALIDRLTNKQKSKLLKSIPEDELLKLIEKENIEFES